MENKKVLIVDGGYLDNISSDKNKIIIDSINSVLDGEYEILVIDNIDKHLPRLNEKVYTITPTPMFEDPIIIIPNEQPWYTKFDKKRKGPRKY